jgi:hypothetical protein
MRIRATEPRTNRHIVMSLGVAAVGIAGFGLFSAPTAAAGPAPSSVESNYLQILADSGAHIVGQDADELKLGYLLCALSQQNGLPPDGSAAYMGAARDSKLCYYVSTNGGPTGAEVQQGLDAWQQQQQAPGIADWNDTDVDDDRVSNADDYFDDDPGAY